MSELKQYVVYSISYNNEIIYVGSTSNFIIRKNSHKSYCYNEDSKNHNLKLYKFIRENKIVFEKLKFEIVEQVENKFLSDKENEKEARKREEHYRRMYSEIIGGKINNSNRAYRTEEELKADIKANNKKYRENNKEEIKEEKKKYRQKNKAKIAEQRAKKYKCKCGSILAINSKSRHDRSQKHIDFINSKQNEESDEDSDEISDEISDEDSDEISDEISDEESDEE